MEMKNNKYLTLLSLRRPFKILPSEVKRNPCDILYSKHSYPLSSATRNSLSPKSVKVEIGSTSALTPKTTPQKKANKYICRKQREEQVYIAYIKS